MGIVKNPLSLLGLPPLPSSVGLPQSSTRRLLLLLVLGQKGAKTDVRMSQRFLTKESARSDNSAVGRHLSALTRDGFLSVTTTSKDDGYEYGRGWRLRRGSGLERRATALANLFFGSKGFCQALVDRPAFGHGFLNVSGCVVLGVVRACKQPVRIRDLKKYLEPLLADATVVSAIRKMVEADVMARAEGFVMLSPGWLIALRRYELASGAQDRASRRDKRFNADRTAREAKKRLAEGRPTDAGRQLLKVEVCVVCNRAVENPEVEHFPPRVFLKKFGVAGVKLAHWALMHPIHKRCHRKYSAWVSAHQHDVLPSIGVSRSEVRHGHPYAAELALYVLLKKRAKRFYGAVDEGDSDSALVAIVEGVRIYLDFVARYETLKDVEGRIPTRSGRRRVRGTSPRSKI